MGIQELSGNVFTRSQVFTLYLKCCGYWRDVAILNRLHLLFPHPLVKVLLVLTSLVIHSVDGLLGEVFRTLSCFPSIADDESWRWLHRSVPCAATLLQRGSSKLERQQQVQKVEGTPWGCIPVCTNMINARYSQAKASGLL